MAIVDKILKNCRIVTTKDILDADIAVDEGKIVQVARNPHLPHADKTYDAHGKLVIPGVIDTHVHLRDPGFTHKEDFKTGTTSAAFGGVTTVFDMPNTNPRTDTKETLEEKRKHVKNKACVDYGLFFEITDYNFKDLPDAIAYKVYFDCAKLSFENLKEVFKKTTGKVVYFHAEDSELLNKSNYTDNPESHTLVSSEEAEFSAVSKILEEDFNGTKVNICHLSTGKALEIIMNSDKDCTCSVTPHHLFFNTGWYKKLGSFAKVTPSIKSSENNQALMENLSKVSFMESDHAPHIKEEKNKDIREASPGFPGVETSLPLLMNKVNERFLTWHDVVRLTSHGVMERFNLKSKGEIMAGKDADLVILDTKREWTIETENQHSKCSWTPYEGIKVHGEIEKVFVRGELIVDEGEFLGKPGFGEEIR